MERDEQMGGTLAIYSVSNVKRGSLGDVLDKMNALYPKLNIGALEYSNRTVYEALLSSEPEVGSAADFDLLAGINIA